MPRRKRRDGRKPDPDQRQIADKRNNVYVQKLLTSTAIAIRPGLEPSSYDKTNLISILAATLPSPAKSFQILTVPAFLAISSSSKVTSLFIPYSRQLGITGLEKSRSLNLKSILMHLLLLLGLRLPGRLVILLVLLGKHGCDIALHNSLPCSGLRGWRRLA
ncbi:hypothetical protein Mapa_004944 [Marchantia paleacea]|nr:hypothetical protein Mapa_004944 [Marchantia paleacea]